MKRKKAIFFLFCLVLILGVCVCVCVCVLCCVYVCSQMLKTEHFHTVFMLVLSEPKTQEPITVGNRSLQKAQGLIS